MTTRPMTGRRPIGRYIGPRAQAPGDTLARPAPSLNVRTAVGNVPNPLTGDRNDLIAVTINRRTDILEEERLLHVKTKGASGLSEAAYLTGREIQRAFEISVKSGSNWLDGTGGSDGSGKVAHLMERAYKLDALARDIRHAVGEAGVDMLRRVLGEGWTYGQIAIREGHKGERGLRQVASRFRWLLHEIVEHRAKRGRVA